MSIVQSHVLLVVICKKWNRARRSTHGVIHDFTQKLHKNPKQLETLGDGTQTKSYLYITDCINAILHGLEKSKEQVEIYNVASEDQINVKTIAEIGVEAMELKDVEFKFTGGVDGGRGWEGDIKNMLLDIRKLKTLGWKPKLNSKQAVREATKHLITELFSTNPANTCFQRAGFSRRILAT